DHDPLAPRKGPLFEYRVSVQTIFKTGDKALFCQTVVLGQYKSERIKALHFLLEDMAEIRSRYVRTIICCQQPGCHVAPLDYHYDVLAQRAHPEKEDFLDTPQCLRWTNTDGVSSCLHAEEESRRALSVLLRNPIPAGSVPDRRL